MSDSPKGPKRENDGLYSELKVICLDGPITSISWSDEIPGGADCARETPANLAAEDRAEE